jgi:hypothetical protein
MRKHAERLRDLASLARHAAELAHEITPNRATLRAASDARIALFAARKMCRLLSDHPAGALRDYPVRPAEADWENPIEAEERPS